MFKGKYSYLLTSKMDTLHPSEHVSALVILLTGSTSFYRKSFQRKYWSFIIFDSTFNLEAFGGEMEGGNLLFQPFLNKIFVNVSMKVEA